MSHLVVHLPAGHLRWKRLRDQPLLTGLPFQVLTVLLDHPDTDWTQQRVAARLNTTMHAVRKAFATLREWGYWRPVRRLVGRARVLHWWGVTDEAGDFGELDARVAREYGQALAAELSQVDSGVVLQPLNDDMETHGSLRGGDTTPPNPVVDNGSPQAGDSPPPRRRSRAVAAVRASRARGAGRLTGKLPPQLAEHTARALALAHDGGVPPHMRRQVAGYVAVCLLVGHDPQRLWRSLTSNMGTAQDVSRVLRYRARKMAVEAAPQLTQAVEAALGCVSGARRGDAVA